MKNINLLFTIVLMVVLSFSCRKETTIPFASVEKEDPATFYGDWESGTLTGTGINNWKYSQIMDPAYSMVVMTASANARQGNNYCRVEVRPGDDPRHANDGTERAEVLRMQGASSELLENLSSGIVQYKFSVKLDNSWQNLVSGPSGVWGSVVQLHGPDALDTSPAWCISAEDEFLFRPVFGLTGAGVNSGDPGTVVNTPKSVGPLNIGKWIDFIINVKYAQDATGFVTIQRRNEGEASYSQVLSLTNTATLQWGTDGIVGDHYMKHGLYRNAQLFTSILYLDGFRRYVITGADTKAPSVPLNFMANVYSSAQLNISWTASTDNIGVKGYKLFRNGVEIATVDSASFNDKGLTPSTKYSYTVSAFDAAGNISALTSPVIGTTPSKDITPPSAPTNVIASTSTTLGTSQIDIIWSASTDDRGVVGYNVIRDGKQLATLDGKTLAYSDQGLTQGTTYAYTVTAFDVEGNVSAPSTSSSATTEMDPPGTHTSTASFDSWAIDPPRSGKFVCEYDVRPLNSIIDGITGLSGAPATAYSNLAAIVAFQTSGVINARNGGGYTAQNVIPYKAFTTYHIRLVLDVIAKSYNAYVTPAGGTEIVIGENYAFRPSGATSPLTTMNIRSETGSFKLMNFSIYNYINADGWMSWPIPGQSGTFTATYDAVPYSSGLDVIFGLSETEATSTKKMSAYMIFNANPDVIQARNGGGAAAVTVVHYIPFVKYSFRMVVNTPAHTFSAYVKPEGGAEQTIATDYAFRDVTTSNTLNYFSAYNFNDVTPGSTCGISNIIIQ